MVAILVSGGHGLSTHLPDAALPILSLSCHLHLHSCKACESSDEHLQCDLYDFSSLQPVLFFSLCTVGIVTSALQKSKWKLKKVKYLPGGHLVSKGQGSDSEYKGWDPFKVLDWSPA